MSNDSNAAFSDLSDSLKTGPIANSKWLIIWSEKEREREREVSLYLFSESTSGTIPRKLEWYLRIFPIRRIDAGGSGGV